VLLQQDKKTFTMQPPNTNIISPHRPIIQHEHQELLKPFFDICLSSNASNCTKETKQLFDKLKEDQRNNFSISEISNALELVKVIFSFENDLNFARNVFTTISFQNTNSNDFLEFIKYSMVDFKLNTQRPNNYQPGEERTYFCEVVIPLFKAFGNTTRAITYNWCEKKIVNSTYLWISNNNFNKNGVKNNLLDGIGRLENIMSYILIESSG
jgi:hypothetical protein